MTATNTFDKNATYLVANKGENPWMLICQSSNEITFIAGNTADIVKQLDENHYVEFDNGGEKFKIKGTFIQINDPFFIEEIIPHQPVIKSLGFKHVNLKVYKGENIVINKSTLILPKRV